MGFGVGVVVGFAVTADRGVWVAATTMWPLAPLLGGALAGVLPPLPPLPLPITRVVVEQNAQATTSAADAKATCRNQEQV